MTPRLLDGTGGHRKLTAPPPPPLPIPPSSRLAAGRPCSHEDGGGRASSASYSRTHRCRQGCRAHLAPRTRTRQGLINFLANSVRDLGLALPSCHRVKTSRWGRHNWCDIEDKTTIDNCNSDYSRGKKEKKYQLNTKLAVVENFPIIETITNILLNTTSLCILPVYPQNNIIFYSFILSQLSKV